MSPLLTDVTSPGAQTSARARLEAAALRAGTDALSTFLEAVYQEAASALSSSVLIAGGHGNPFTRGSVRRAWMPFVDEFGAALVQTGGIKTKVADSPIQQAPDSMTLAQRLGVTDPFVVSMLDRLSDEELPGEIHTSVLTVLTEVGQRKGIKRQEILSALREALDPSTGVQVRDVNEPDGLRSEGVNWSAKIERLARTEATSLFTYVTEQEIARRRFPGKKWVSIGDSRVRHSHAEANGQVVRVGETFLVGVSAMTGPGDPSAPYSERANCRCRLIGLGFKAARAAGIR